MVLNWVQSPGATAAAVTPVRANRVGFATARDMQRHRTYDQHLRPSVQQGVTSAKKAFGATFDEYCSTTKVNGPYYWQKGATKGAARVIWVIIPIVLLAMGLVLVFSLWQRYLASPTRMTIGRPLSVVEVPFPAITICHPRTVVEFKANDFVERM